STISRVALWVVEQPGNNFATDRNFSDYGRRHAGEGAHATQAPIYQIRKFGIHPQPLIVLGPLSQDG
ncbi:MAG: hypothetical protein ACRD3W_12445, partial [Terriglobales bacterium]